MSHLPKVRHPWPARWSTSSDSSDEEKRVPKDIPLVPTILITPPPSPTRQHAHPAETAWSTSKPNPFYLYPPPYLRPLHHDYLNEPRHRSLERRHHKGSWWTLAAVFLLLILSSSLHSMYSIHSSEARERDGLAAGLTRQEPDEPTRALPVDSGSSVVPFRFELPRFLEWLAVDRKGLGSPTLMEDHRDDTLAGTQGAPIPGIIGAGRRPRQGRDVRYRLRTVDRVVELGMERE